MARTLGTKVRREDLKAGENLCDHCTAKCCHYFCCRSTRPKNGETLSTFVGTYCTIGRVCSLTMDVGI